MIAELDLGEVFIDRAQKSGSSMVVVWDKDGRIIYHSERPLHGQSIRNALPSLATAAQAQSTGLHSLTGDNNRDYVMAFAPLPRLNITVAAGIDRAALVSSAHRWGIAGLFVALALAGIAAFAIDKVAHRKSGGIARVTEGLTAVAKGQLDHRVELRSSDEARSMADNLNILAERMRAQYDREAEARQFESFFRLSAMLTHDLKNSIEALSLIVGNMERHFHNEQFRVDAMKSLTSATDKLRGLVARLSRPVTSLSGEHKLPDKVDLVPILKRSIKATAEPSANQHQINVELPEHLFAVVDVGRVEEVFENLILNALEAMMHKHGTLTITTEKTAKGEPTIIFTDTGCGMSQNFVKESLFRPFRTTKKAGVGLGLYTCREVIAASGGRIQVESAEGVGTTFRVVLPSGS
jgi:signal transduction histidine kinase